MAAREPGEKPQTTLPCPNPDKPYTLWGLVAKLQDRAFAGPFFDLLKSAEQDEPGARECLNTYFEPETRELEELGIPASDIPRMRRCTDSGLLMLVTAKQNSS